MTKNTFDIHLRIEKTSEKKHLLIVEAWPKPESMSECRFELHSKTIETALNLTQKLKSERVFLTGHLSEIDSKQVELLGSLLQQLLLPEPLLLSLFELHNHISSQTEFGGINIYLKIESSQLLALPWECLYLNFETIRSCIIKLKNDPQHKDKAKGLTLLLNPPLFPFLQNQPLDLKIIRLSANEPGASNQPIVDKKIRLLFVGSNPRKDLDPQSKLLLSAFDEISHRLDIDELQSPGVHRATLAAKLKGSKPYQVLVFYGHGQYQTEGQSYLILDKLGGGEDHLKPKEFANWLLHHARNPVQLVVLIACESGIELAQQMAQAGVPAVVAMQGKITEEDARRFCHGFFQAAASGASLSKSLQLGRESLGALNSKAFLDNFAWTLPVLVVRSPEIAQRTLKDPVEIRRLQAPELTTANNPYRGLQPYEKQHCHLFFGREKVSKKLLSFVENHPLTVVGGASGIGKSSLVMAGLLPKLPETDWILVGPIRPGNTPLENFIEALKLKGFIVSDSDKDHSEILFEPSILTHSFQTWIEEHPKKKLLIFFDQFEELFTLYMDESLRIDFFQVVQQLLDKFTQQLRVVLTVRSDIEGQFFKANSYLQNYWQKGRFDPISSMRPSELRAVIEAPADEALLTFEPPELVDRLIEDVLQMPGDLPLLSFALSELYRIRLDTHGKRQDWSLRLEDYVQMGGVSGALSQRLDKEFDQLGIMRQGIMKRVLLRMVSIEGTEPTKQKVFLEELDFEYADQNKRVEEVIDRLLQARILVAGIADGKEYIEPAHDAVVRGWWQFQRWLKKDSWSISIINKLRPAVDEWKNTVRKQDKRGLLWINNPNLSAAVELIPQLWLNKVETEFIKKSNRKKVRKIWWGISFVTVFFSILGSFILIFDNSMESENMVELYSKAKKAHQLLSENLLENRTNAQSSETNLLLTIQSLNFSKRWVNQPQSSEIYESTFADMQLSSTPNDISNEEHTDDLKNPPLRLFNTQVFDNKFNSLIMHPLDNQSILTGHLDDELKVWLFTEDILSRKINHENKVLSATYAPFGDSILTGGLDGTARLWNARDGELLQTFNHEGGISSVAIRPGVNRKRFYGEEISGDVVTGGVDGTAKLWQMSDGTLSKTLEHKNRILSIAMNYKYILTGSQDNTAKLWRDYGVHEYTFEHNEDVLSVALSSDGQYALTGSQDDTAKLWQLSSGQLLNIFEHQDDVLSVAFSENEQYALTGSRDNTAKLWQLPGGQLLHTFEYPEDVILVNFGPENKFIYVSINNPNFRTIKESFSMNVKANCNLVTRNLTWQEWNEHYKDISYDKACYRYPVHSSVFEAAERFLNEGQFVQAKNLYQRIIELESPLSSALNRIDNLVRNREVERARLLYHRLLDLEPGFSFDPEQRITKYLNCPTC